MIDVSKTDMARLVKILDDAACYYNQNGKSNRELNRARVIGLLNKKLKRKLKNEESKQSRSS